MKLLTFLGVGNYQETKYIWNDNTYRARFAPVASCHFLKPEELIVFLSEEAQAKVYPAMEEEVKNTSSSVHITPLEVPLGANENEVWQVFDTICTHVHPGEEAAFDITHGLRSYPLLGLLSAAFLRSGLNVQIKAVLYGAYDIGRQNNWEYTPMFDLSPMLTLLEWSAAADRFNRTGDSRYLASLVKQQRKEIALKAGKDRNMLDQAGSLGNLGESLHGISQSLNLIRPYQALEQTARLVDQINQATSAIASVPSTRPFSLLLESIERTYAHLGLNEPSTPENAWETLNKQRLLIDWYVEREHWVQAVTLAREWLISWVMAHLGHCDFLNKSTRDRITELINSEAYAYRTAHQKKEAFEPIFFKGIPHADQALDLWNSLVNVRNDIDHAGMRPDPGKPDALIKQIVSFQKGIQKLPLAESL